MPPRVRTLAVIFARAALTPGSAATSASACAFIWSLTGQAGVVSSIVKSTSPPLTCDVLDEAEGHDVLVQVGVLHAAQGGEHLLLRHAHAVTSGRNACCGQDARAASTTSCSFWNLSAGLPSIFVRMMPLPSMTNVVG